MLFLTKKGGSDVEFSPFPHYYPNTIYTYIQTCKSTNLHTDIYIDTHQPHSLKAFVCVEAFSEGLFKSGDLYCKNTNKLKFNVRCSFLFLQCPLTISVIWVLASRHMTWSCALFAHTPPLSMPKVFPFLGKSKRSVYS